MTLQHQLQGTLGTAYTVVRELGGLHGGFLVWRATGPATEMYQGIMDFRFVFPSEEAAKAYLAIRAVLSDAERALAPGGDRADSRRLTIALSDD